MDAFLRNIASVLTPKQEETDEFVVYVIKNFSKSQRVSPGKRRRNFGSSTLCQSVLNFFCAAPSFCVFNR